MSDKKAHINRQLLQILLQAPMQLVFGMLFMVVFAVFAVAPAKYMKDIVDAIGSGKAQEISQYIYVGTGIVLLFFLKGLCFFGQSYLMGSVALKLIRELRGRLFRKLVYLPMAYFNKSSTGDLASRFTTDLNVLSEAVTLGISGPLRSLPQIILLLFLMYTRSWQLMLVTFILLPLAAGLIRIFGRKNKKFTSKRLKQYSSLTNLVGEAMSGIRVVKAFNMEAYEEKRFERENKRLYRYFMHSIRIDSYSFPIIEFLGGIFAAVMLTYGGYLVIHEHITGGDFASFLISFFMLYEPIKKLNGFTLKIQEGSAAAKRIFEVLNTEMKIADKPNAPELSPLEEEIKIRIDHFAYDDGPVVLRNIQINIKKGQVAAFVGASGSGKSTLANLIPRFYDLEKEHGSITIDGVDIRDCSLASLRRQIAMVTQEVVLFNDTVSNNIAYGEVEQNQDQIETAAKAGHAHDFVVKLPEKYEEMVGEKGSSFSGGQRQRLSISRALIKDAQILILDEATSALDNESEQMVQKAFDNLMQGRTTLVIAHRLSTIQHADVIYVMKEGKVVEQGTHNDLMKQAGEYKNLYEMQYSEI